MAEQLLYTWAERGPTGRGGFQVVAASPGLSELSSPVAQAAVQLCRAPGASGDRTGTADVSFGWVDEGRWRLVFNRVPAGRDSIGRQGGFCAHIVAGEIPDLPTSRIVHWFGSPTWWTRDEGNWDDPAAGLLDPLLPEAFSPGTCAEVDQAKLAAFVEALLGRGARRLLIPEDPVQVAALAAGAERAVRGILEGTSLSTSESERYAGSFDLAGIGVGGWVPFGSSRWDHCVGEVPAAGRVAQAVVAGTLHAQLSAIAAKVSRTGEGIEAGRFVAMGDADLIGPKSLAMLLDREDLLRLTARALADNSEAAWTAVDRSARTLSAEHLDRLGTALGTLIADSGLIGRLGSYLTRATRSVVQLADATAAVVITRCEQQPALWAAIDHDAHLQLLRYLGRCGRDMGSALALIDSSAVANWSIISATDLPPDWRARAAARLFTESDRPPGYLIGRLAADAKLLTALVRQLSPLDPLLSVIRDCELDDAHAIALNACEVLTERDSRTVLTSLAERLPPDEKVGFVVHYLSLRPPVSAGQASAELHLLASRVIAWAVLSRAQDFRMDVRLTGPERSLVSEAGGKLRFAWQNIEKHGWNARSPVDVLESVRTTFAGAEPVVRQAADQIALRFAVTDCTTPEHVAELASRLLQGPALGHEAGCAQLAASAFHSSSAMPAVAVLLYIADRIADGHIQISSKAVTDPVLAGILQALVAKLPAVSMDEVGASLKDAPKPARQWWSALAQHGPLAAIQVKLPRFPKLGNW